MVILTNGMTSVQNALMYRILDTYIGKPEKDWSAYYLQRSKQADERKAKAHEKAQKERVDNTRPSRPLDAYAGTYGGEMYGDATVTLENGRLVLQFLPAKDLVGDLHHWHYDTFEIKWRKEFAWFGAGKVQFFMNEKADVVELKIDVPNEDFWFTELEFKRKK